MNLRKKKQKFSYQDSQFLSKNYEYQELTKGKRRRENHQPNEQPEQEQVRDSTDYTLIFTQIMDSIRKNLGQAKAEQIQQQHLEQELLPREESNRGEIKKKVKLSQKSKAEIQQQQDLFFKNSKNKGVTKNQAQNKQRRAYRLSESNLNGHALKNKTQTEVQKHIGANSRVQYPSSVPQYFSQNKRINILSSESRSCLLNQTEDVSAINITGRVSSAVSSKESKPYLSKPSRSGKLFTRSSFHIAIAYYIHLKKSQFYNDPLEIDPAYHSKKLKQAIQLKSI